MVGHCGRIGIVATATIAVLLISSATATTYYVSKQAGSSDGNSGTTWGQAWSTVSKVNSTVAAGDTVFFGAGTWYNSTVIPPTGGTAADPTVYACSTMTVATERTAAISAGIQLPT